MKDGTVSLSVCCEISVSLLHIRLDVDASIASSELLLSRNIKSWDHS